MNKTILSFVSLICVLTAASSGHAQTQNGGFETGDFSSWATIGQTSVKTASFGLAPIAGTYSALASTDGAAVSALQLEGFANLDPGTLNGLQPAGGFGVTQGSAIQQTFRAQAGDVLSFRYFFLTNQGIDTTGFNDFAFVVLNGTAERIAQVNPDTNVDIPDTNNPAFARATTERQYTRLLTQTGTYTLTLGAVDVGDDVIDSGLFVDAVSITATPEPGTLLLAGIGIFAFMFRSGVRKIVPKGG